MSQQVRLESSSAYDGRNGHQWLVSEEELGVFSPDFPEMSDL